MTEELLKDISGKLAKKGDINLTFSSTTSDFTTQIYPPLQLDEKNWVVGLVCLDTYYSFTNINVSNNRFTYSVDGGTTWQTILIPVGCYEITQINEEVKRLLGTNGGDVEIAPNIITLGSIINITNENFKIDFSTKNSIASVLGFKSKTIGQGRNESDNIVNILNVNSILVNCDVINNSYLNGSQSPVIYSFFPNVRPGSKIVQEPTTITYLPVNRSFVQAVRIWITDQDGVPIDFRGEKITCRIVLKYL